MERVIKAEYRMAFIIAIYLFIAFYPMLISIYVFLPLFIGAMSYALVRGLEKGKTIYLVVAIVFLINLEVNLSLPLFLTIISSFIFYVALYPSLKHFRHCHMCKRLISVLLLDILYLGALFFFDFVFETHSIVLDNILLYSLVVDMLIVMLL
ncbi:hypothetical protein MNB_SV-13-503 [hydrothermal vent metagenome]|uniref:Uncharacterized protein n=1 Tax=hydrothermal vent metagenome TaxID=652676 RepID=A0A1W1CZF2_9ZZZZ